jgi:flagellar protein FlbD
MIQLTRLNHEAFLLNSDLLEHVDITPDTIIALTNGHKFVVMEKPEEVVRRVLEFRRSIYAGGGVPEITRTLVNA